MKNRRDFLKAIGVMPLATAVLPALEAPSDALADRMAPQAEFVSAGQPMSYWLVKGRSQTIIDKMEHRLTPVLTLFGETAVPHLIEGFVDGLDKPRVMSLTLLASPHTVRLLTTALGHSHPYVRHGALLTLEQIFMDETRRARCLGALREAVPDMVHALDDANSCIAEQAAMLLQHFGHEAGLSWSLPTTALDSLNPYKRALAIEKFATASSEAERLRPVVLASLRAQNRTVRVAAAKALATLESDHPEMIRFVVDSLLHGELTWYWLPQRDRILSKALPRLWEAINRGDEIPGTGCEIEEALKRCPPESAQPVLEEMLQSESLRVRLLAMAGMSSPPTADMVSDLIQGLQDEDPFTQQRADQLLTEHSSLAVVAQRRLTDLLSHQDPMVRIAAMQLLKKLGEKARSSLPRLRENLGHSDSSVRVEAAIAIGWIEGSGRELAEALANAEGSQDSATYAEIVDTLSHIDPDAELIVPHLADHLRDVLPWADNTEFRKHLGPSESLFIRRLVQLLGDDERTTQDVISFLAEIGMAAIEPLMEVVQRGELSARQGALSALAIIDRKGTKTLPLPLAILQNGPPALRPTAAMVLKYYKHGPEAMLPILPTLLEDQDLGVLFFVIQNLKGLGSRAAVAKEGLSRLLWRSDHGLHQSILEALSKIGSDVLPVILEVARRHPDPHVRVDAVETLGKLELWSNAVTNCLNHCMRDSDEEVRAAADRALSALRSGPLPA